MSVLREHFRPSKEEIWRKLCGLVGGVVIQNQDLGSTKLEVHHKQWTITLDTFTELIGENEETYTRLRAPFVNNDGFRFTIYRKGFFSLFRKLLGMKNVLIGDPVFDDAFVIDGNNELILRELFSDLNIRHRIEQQPKIYLSVWHDEGWFQPQFPEGVDELYLRVPGIVSDIEQLKSLYELFAEVLIHLCQIGSAYQKHDVIDSKSTTMSDS